MNVEEIRKKVRSLCENAGLQFFFAVPNASEWAVTDCEHLRKIVSYHKELETSKQEPCEDAVSKQDSVLGKIKAEIEQIEINGHIRDVECFRAGINVALNVIDKYKVESEDKE